MYFGGIARRVFIDPLAPPAAMETAFAGGEDRLRLARACEGSEYG